MSRHTTRFLPEPDTISFELAVEDVSCHNGNDGTATISNIVGESNNYTVSWGTATGGQTGLTANNLRAGNYVVTVNGDRGCSNTSTIRVSQPEPITIEFQTEDISCFGGNEGSITANATGGRPDYVFNWSNSLPTGPTVNNLVAGTYNLTVTDSRNCPSIANVTIDQPETVAVNLTVTDVSCFGGRDGRIEVNTVGGTPPYAYSTDNINFNGISTLIGLEADNLAVYVRDDAGCLYAQAVAVAEPPEFMLDAGPDITINLGDTVNLDIATIDAGRKYS